MARLGALGYNVVLVDSKEVSGIAHDSTGNRASPNRYPESVFTIRRGGGVRGKRFRGLEV